tara:strand:- start:21095 stop:21694 length:600 start_codon:yes stop_codon:yes gene_type:complete
MRSFDEGYVMRVYRMDDTELMKKLLDGTLDPVELENNPHLYVLAERIYGREALEEMGIMGPKIDAYGITEEKTTIVSDVEIPEFLPDMNSIIKEQGKIIKKRRKMVLFIGFSGLLTIITNIYLGMGEILCSLGVANMKEICVEGKTQVVWLKATSWDGLHEIDTWIEPRSLEIFDISLIIIFSLMFLIGIFFKKKVNTS